MLIQIIEINISKFDPSSKPIQKTVHNSDFLINSEDHSGIKNSIKTLFESTAPMSSKDNIGMYVTPLNETSRFTLNLLGDSEECHVSQFKSSDSKLKTDEHGNRLSIMPKEERPKPLSKDKKETK